MSRLELAHVIKMLIMMLCSQQRSREGTHDRIFDPLVFDDATLEIQNVPTKKYKESGTRFRVRKSYGNAMSMRSIKIEGGRIYGEKFDIRKNEFWETFSSFFGEKV